jgi:hypothetical protein
MLTSVRMGAVVPGIVEVALNQLNPEREADVGGESDEAQAGRSRSQALRATSGILDADPDACTKPPATTGS